ncbi:hypothetical protein SSX86_016174 [Deinandra increscens subsp. villosa]|uniref:Ribosomal protein L34Ae n=1 Tax=Deinandra increscens subsp. villosa TaxID=3103831 RepID=A0AAP0D282_9ASTR
MDSVLELLYPKLVLFVLGFWSFVSSYLLPLLRCLTRYSKGMSNDSNDSRAPLTEPMEEKQEFLEFSGKEKDWGDEKDDDDNKPSEFSFTFKFPTFEEFSKNPKDFSQLLNFNEDIDSSEILLEECEVDTNSSGGLELSECWVFEFEGSVNDNQECMVNSPNLKNIGEVEEKEETCAFSEENLQKNNVEFVDLSSNPNMDSIGSCNLHSPTSDVSVEKKIAEMKEEKEELFDTYVSEKLQKNLMKRNKTIGHNPTSYPRMILVQNLGNGNGDGNEKNFLGDTTNKLESLWEHQELIEQLQMEIKKVKAIGLPTIFEESESPPKIMEELKPWKIEEVYQNGGGKMGEVHKFYKSYRERMRKFDIFNYQKMYTIGFLQLKDPPQSSSSSRSSVSEITTLFGQSFLTNKGKKTENDPTIKFIKELESDLEVVYVAQMCLSWEILHWQYEKALDIWESDLRGYRRFNDIAGEFQQFQVLMQRFIEDEPFQGPRIQTYVKNRCVFRNLLQVPMIKDDHLKNKKARSEVVYDITSDALVEILEESIRIFWRFVRADKYKCQTPAEFQTPEDSQLFMDLRKDLHKKERKLKEQLRSGNCILKKLKKCREDEAEDQVLYFFCQVDMKLVSRVLQMSRLTSDQLIWCHNKLSRVSFVNHKIHVEPSFLLFPC